MRAGFLPAVAGGEPIRQAPLPYGRHTLEPGDVNEVVAALNSGTLTGGSAVSAFEEALAEVCGVSQAVAVCNGTAALHLAVVALGLGPEDNMVTTPLTFVASANAALFVGATPRFADIGADRCLDPAEAAAAVGDRTRLVLPVDFGGLPADIDALRSALPPSMPVLADAAHSLGGSLNGRPVGSLADVTVTSFHPVKQLTTGEGGACLTDNAALAEEIRSRRSHGMTSTASDREGRKWRYDVRTLGYNYRLTDFQAALGSAQLPRLAAIVSRREELAQRYDTQLASIPGVGLPPRPHGRQSAWHLYPVTVDPTTFGLSRDELVDALRMENIEATLHYPAAHLLSLYRGLGHQPGELPRAEQLSDRLVTLPLFPSMTDRDQDDVVTALERIAAWRGGA